MNIFSFMEAISTLQASFLILGLVLLMIEAFMPGFEIVGGVGLALLAIGIILTARTPFEAMVMIIILIIIIAVLVFFVLKSAKRGMLYDKMILKYASTKESGYSAVSDATSLIGKEGVAVTTMRPAGTGEFEGQRIDVVSEGSYIEKGNRIRVISVEGRRIVVQLIGQ